MSQKHIEYKSYRIILTTILLIVFLAACAPTETATPNPTPTEAATDEPTLASSPTATIEPTLSPEEEAQLAQDAVRAEVLSFGINLDDLSNSENEFIGRTFGIDDYQEKIDSNFGDSEQGFAIMVVLEMNQLSTVEEYEQAFTTDGGWKFIVWAKAAYKMANGDWMIANLPLQAYNETTGEMWRKMARNVEPLIDQNVSVESVTSSLAESDSQFVTDLQDAYQTDGFYLDAGTIFRLYTAFPDPTMRLNAGDVGETPRFTEEEMEDFRLTGDPSIYEYQAPDGTYFIWPFVDFDSSVSRI
jgi:hypothetical protein